MPSKLGCHWMREHPDQQDMPHIAAMQYKSVKLFKPAWDNADFCRDLLTVLPGDSYILARDHSLSEQKEDMWRDAVAAGIDHANQWIDKVHAGEYHLPLDRTFFLPINEPDATNGDRNKIDLYTEAFLDRLGANGLRGGAFNFSTGHPRTVDGTPNTPADYSVFERSHQAIVRGHHIAVLHIYGTGAVPCAPGHYDRLKACTWTDVEWVVGEMGVDSYVIGGGAHDGFHKFFDGRLNDYCGWLDTLIMGINDSRIHSYQVFTYDFAHPWSEFDIHPIRHALETFQWQHMTPTAPTPTPPGPTTLLYVNVPKGARLRGEPNTDAQVLDNIPFGEQVYVTGRMEITGGAQWTEVIAPNGRQGWIFGALLSPTEPGQTGTGPTEPRPEGSRPPTGDKWQRTIAFILGEEGGFNANDEGHPANFGINQGANPDLDVKSITREQAIERYRTGYWIASGADKLDWPFCLLVMDASVQHGDGVARQLLAESGGNMWRFQGLRQLFYGQIKEDSWQRNGRGWMNRMGNLMVEASK